MDGAISFFIHTHKIDNICHSLTLAKADVFKKEAYTNMTSYYFNYQDSD